MPDPFDLSGLDEPPGRPAYSPTRLESLDAVQKAVAQQSRPPQHPSPLEDDAATFRPVRRPPVAMLCVLDDGSDDGEWVRLRSGRIIIGRTQGDVLIPHDDRVSSQHAELTRKVEDGHCSWYLTDQHSTNGTYVFRKTHPLRHAQELLLGGCRWRFELPQPTASVQDGEPGVTRGMEAIAPSALFPTLTEVAPQGPGRRFVLSHAESWFGRDAANCQMAVPDDPMLGRRHALFTQAGDGGWEVRDAGSRNGVWVRVDRVQIRGTCKFQLGEQRFFLRVQSP